MAKKKRRQGFVKQFKVENMYYVNGVPTVDSITVNKVLADGTQIDKELSVVPMSENRLYRMYGGDTNPDVEGPADWTNFCVISADTNVVDEILLSTVFTDGFMHNNRKYKVFARSVAGMRVAKAFCTSNEELWDSLEDLTYGEISKILEDPDTGEVDMSKVRSREALAFTTTTEIDVEFTHGVLDDFSRTIEIKGREYVDGVMRDVVKEIRITPTDGMGFMDYETAVKVATDLGLDYVPTAFQVRFAGAKGLLIVWKWDKEAKPEWDKNILFLDSMWKYDFDAEKYNKENGNAPKLEVASWVKPAKSEFVNLNYQFIQALNIKGEDLISLSKEALQKVENGVLVNPDVAKLFLGMLDASGDEDYDSSLVSSLTRTLDADETMLGDIRVQKKLKALLEKFVLDMRKGKVPVHGFYRYIIADPSVIFGNKNGTLKARQYYHNSIVELYAGFRSPLIHYSEAVKLQTVAVKEWKEMKEKTDGFRPFSYLENLIVFNTYDDTLPRMGGADVDGDKIMITADKRIVDAIIGGDIIYAEGKSGKKTIYSKMAVTKYDLLTMKKSRIGIITDYATGWTDIRQVTNQDKYDVNVQMLRVIQGEEIDAPKTGWTPTIPEAIMLTLMPHWLEKNLNKKTKKLKPEDRRVKEYHSTSAMGQLYDFILGCPCCSEIEGAPKCKHKEPVTGYWKAFNEKNHIQPEKKSLEIISAINSEEASHIRPYVTRLFDSYRVELGILMQYATEHGLSDDDDTFNGMMNEVFSRYQRLVADIDADPRTVAGMAYYVAYEREESKGRGLSFPWVVCEDALIALLAEIANKESNRFSLVPVHGKYKKAGKFTFYKGQVMEDVPMYNNAFGTRQVELMYADVEGGEYEVVEINNRFYARVPRTNAPVIEQKTENVGRRKVQLAITGFRHVGHTAQSAHKLMTENNGVVDLLKNNNYIGVYVNGEQVGSIKGQDDFTMLMLIGKRLEIINLDKVQLTYVSVKDGSIKPVGQFNVDAEYTGIEIELDEEVELDEEQAPADEIAGETVDVKTHFDAKFQSFGFENVSVDVIDGLGEIGTMKIAFKGAEYVYFVNRDLDENIFFTGRAIKSDEIRQTLAQYVHQVIRAQIA